MMFLYSRPARYGVIAILLAITSSVYAETRINLHVGLAKDFLQWNIANDITGTTTPNILSELTWDNMQVLQQYLDIEHRPDNQKVVLTGNLAFGYVYSGDNQDSDYNGNNRTLEFSRSNNSSDGSITASASIGVGYGFDVSNKRIEIRPMLGYAVHRQFLKITDGNQTIPNSGPFPGLDSSYDTTWYGHWLGAKLTFRQAYGLFIDSRLHFVDYEAVANWNLRSDFQHPVSFRHDADGLGHTLRIGMVFEPDTNFNYGITFVRQDWRTDPGVDTVYFSNGSVGVTRLNEVKWTSTSLHASFNFNF